MPRRKSPGVTASQVYRSAKVPFAFDYADNDTDVTPGSAGDHGVHVSGIAAANDGVVADVVGVAPGGTDPCDEGLQLQRLEWRDLG